jgi:hypothetical protein
MNDTRFASDAPDLWAKFKRDYEKDCELVGRMRRAGVEIPAGSDMLDDLLAKAVAAGQNK